MKEVETEFTKDENGNTNDININFVGDNGKVCDFIIFKDIDSKVLGMAIVNDKTIELPEGTTYCDYYHQSYGNNKFISRIILGEKIKEDDNSIIVEMSSQGTKKEFNAKENVDYVFTTSNKEDFMVEIINETMRNMETPTPTDEQPKKSI